MDDLTLHNVPISQMIARKEEIDARERVDAGMRLAMPMLFDGLGPDPEPTLTLVHDQEVIGAAADSLAAARTELARDLKHLDKNAPRHLYFERQALISLIDDQLQACVPYIVGDLNG